MTEIEAKAGDDALSAVSDRGLRAFCEAARWGSLTRAADQLGLGQPAISHAISRLEAALDVRRLDRSRTGVVLATSPATARTTTRSCSRPRSTARGWPSAGATSWPT